MARPLDFIVIGAQKSGTTSLWQHLRGHPRVAMPEMKEEPFFSRPEAEQPGAFDRFMEAHFGRAPPNSLLGKATPQYMTGSEHANVERVAQRIAEKLPDVRLIALLRDPIERAASHFRMSVRRGWEKRTFEAAATELLDARQLREARDRPTPTNSYLVNGEYGRVLGIYLDRFPAESLHVEQTADLDREPGAVLDRVLEFLSLPTGYRPERLDARHHRGGTRRLLDPEAEAELREFLAEHAWPHMGDRQVRSKELFAAFMETWNVNPESGLPALSDETRAALEAHYRADAERLAELGIPTSWLDEATVR